MQFLVSELAKEETLLEAGLTYHVWSPYDSLEAAEVLLKALQADKETTH